MTFRAPSSVSTARLLLRRPDRGDAEAIFTRYASDRDALRYMGWPAHESLADTRAFLGLSDAEWAKWSGGPYLVFSAGGALLGGTGFAFEASDSAATGYVLARDAWGKGYASRTSGPSRRTRSSMRSPPRCSRVRWANRVTA